jgi:hypothetical protein
MSAFSSLKALYEDVPIPKVVRLPGFDYDFVELDRNAKLPDFSFKPQPLPPPQIPTISSSLEEPENIGLNYGRNNNQGLHFFDELNRRLQDKFVCKV